MTKNNRLQNWAEAKRQVALRLLGGDCGGSYDEAALILCSILSALSAFVWDVENNDKKKFVQLLSEFTPARFNATRICIPLLLEDHTFANLSSEASEFFRKYRETQPTRVLTGDDIDKSEKEVRLLLPSITRHRCRQFSYASVLYKGLRSGYAHKYHPTGNVERFGHSLAEQSPVSYVNWMDGHRGVHFNILWLGDLVVETASSVDRLEASLPKPEPSNWWIDGPMTKGTEYEG